MFGHMSRINVSEKICRKFLTVNIVTESRRIQETHRKDQHHDADKVTENSHRSGQKKKTEAYDDDGAFQLRMISPVIPEKATMMITGRLRNGR